MCLETHTAIDMIEETYGTSEKKHLQRISDNKDFKEKTPLGPIPRFVHDGRRIKHLLKTFRDFAEKETPVKVEWVDELEELLYRK